VNIKRHPIKNILGVENEKILPHLRKMLNRVQDSANREDKTSISQTSKEDNTLIQGQSSLAVTGKGFGQEPGEGFSTVREKRRYYAVICRL
jgi:hypothetical protein